MSVVLTDMREAVEALVDDGTSIACGLALEAAIPFAFAHEVIRQQRRDLRLIGPIADAIFDQLVGAGCVTTIEAAWVGNVTTGSGSCFRRAVEHGEPHPIVVREHTNRTVSLALTAAGHGVGYLPTRTALGSDIADAHDGFAHISCPFTAARHLAVKAIAPDLAVVHVQRADESGNAQAWGNLGLSLHAVEAAKRVLVIAEEVVDTAELRATPNATLLPGQRVDAVVHEPGGTHPAPLMGYAEHDPGAYEEYGQASRTAEGMAEWLATWVYGVPDRAAYLEEWRRVHG